MTVKDANTLKSYFALGKVPVPANYNDLVDTLFAQGGGGGNHNHDDRYVRLSLPNNISAVHTFNPSTVGPPFILSGNAQGQTITGLKADQLNKSINAGSGLIGGGVLTSNITLSVGAGRLITVGSDTVGLSNGAVDYQFIGTSKTPWDPTYINISSLAGSGLNFYEGALLVGQGAGLTVSADAIALTIPGTLSVSSTNNASGSHTHGITTSSNPSGASILASDSNSALTLSALYTNEINNKSVATNLSINSNGDIVFDPANKDIVPKTNYDLNLGTISEKYLTLHAAELWVETLVAAEVIATVGGHILVAPTTILTSNVNNTQTQLCLNNGFETAGSGGADVFLNWIENAGSGTITRDATYKISGTYSCKLAGVTTLYNTYVYQSFAVAASEGYTLSFWFRNSNAINPGRYGIWDFTHSSWIIPLTGLTGSTGVFTQYAVNFVIPSACTTIYLYFYCPSTGTGQYTHFDAVYLYKDFIYTKHNNLVAEDIIYLNSSGKIEFMKIISIGTGITSPYTYYVERDLDGTGTNIWFAGDAVLNTGTTGDGYIDIYADHSIKGTAEYGPTVAGIIRTGAIYNNLIEAWAVGNLDGLYGYSGSIYGAAFGRYQVGYDYITIEPTNGIQMKSNRSIIGEKVHVKLNLQGDFFLGSDISLASATNLAVFNIAQTYNSESMGAGDLLLGDNSASKANLLWDKSAGTLLFRTASTTNMTFNTDGSIRIGATGNNYALFTSTSFIFRSMSDIPLLTVDGAAPEILLGLPQVVKVNEYGLRLDATGTTNGKLILADTIAANDDGMFYIGAGYAATGEFLASLKMPVFTGSAGMYNDLQLYTGSVKGSGTIGAGLELYSGYSATTSFAKITIDDTMVATFGTAYTQLGSDLRLAGGMTVGFTDIDPASGSILMLEISAPGTPTSTHGVLYTGTDSLFHFKSDGGIVYEMPIHTQDTDYFSGSSKVGWASYTTSFLSYARIGNLVFVHFYISGTSNATTTTFTVPFANGEAQNLNFMFRAVDNGTASTTGTGTLASSSSTVTLYKDATGAAAWTNTGTKSIFGHFVYWV